MKKNSNLFWGMIFVAMALLVLAGQFKVFGDISIVRMSLGILTIIISIWGLLRRNFVVFLFFLAFFCQIFDDILNIPPIAPGPIFLAALLGSIGLSMIFPKKYPATNNWKKHENFDNIINEDDESEVKCYTRFGSTVKYVNTSSLTKADIYCTFGGADIYFDAAKLKNNTASINLDVSFAGVEIYLPKDWVVEQSVNATLGGIDIVGSPHSSAALTVTLTGNVRFGGVTIHYV